MLDDFTRFEFTDGGTTRDVYRTGTGPAVIVIHEVPGITPKVAAFGQRVAATGCTAVLPSLFGTPGRAMSMPYVLNSITRACVAKEFHAWALASTSPITVWLRALAAQMHEECGGPGVGAVGMCFTGNFALAMMVDDRMLAPVLSQPSLPFPVGKARQRDLAISPDDLSRVKERARRKASACSACASRRIPQCRQRGSSVSAKSLATASSRSRSTRRRATSGPTRASAHSVLTEHLVDESGHPTRAALDQVLAFFGERLLTTTNP